MRRCTPHSVSALPNWRACGRPGWCDDSRCHPRLRGDDEFELLWRQTFMKLLRYGPVGQERPGLLDAQGRIRSLHGVVPDLTGDALSPESLAKLRALDPAQLPLVEGTPRLGAPVGQVRQFMALGVNYALHAKEAGAQVPQHPTVFAKAVSCI